MQLSKGEEKAYGILKRNELQVFRLRDLALLLNIDKTKTYNLIKALKGKNVIDVLSSGVYSLKDTDDFVAGAYFNWPSYVSFLSALNYYGFSDNLPKKITFASTKYKKNQRFEYVCLSKKRYLGYKKIGEIIVAEKEKAFVDSLLLPKYSGGIKEIARLLLENINNLDIDKLLNYSLRVDSKMVLRRLGFILDDKLTKKNKKLLLSRIGKGVGFLDPAIKTRKNLNKQWLLYTNLE
jgi:predicted transcriptional regulator of viral defense system